DFFAYLSTDFSWRHFIAVSLWLYVLFLVYVTAVEFGRLFGRGEVWRLLVTRRPSALPRHPRPRLRELLRVSPLAAPHSGDELRDPSSTAHRELVDILDRLAR